MSALGHFFEDEGLATTGISLVRDHTERMKPPRALWVPFELGRPLGIPGDAAFQRRVIMAALGLLAADTGPVLEDYAEDAPPAAAPEDSEGWACPVGFAPPPVDPDDLGAAVAVEIDRLHPWFEVAKSGRGRTTVGVSGMDIAAAAGLVASVLDGGLPASPVAGRSSAEALRLAAEDLKAYYLESATARPGQASSGEVYDWLWRETALADLFRRVAAACADSADADVRVVGTSALVPRARAAAPD